MVTLVNRAKVVVSSAPGTGTIDLGAAVDGYQTFADAGVTDGQSVRYVIEDGSSWEIGTGTYTAAGPTLSRTVIESSSADAEINASAAAVVFVTAAAADIVQPSDLATVATTGAYSDLSGLPTIPAAYTDADVDTHLNTGTASSGEVLSWTGTDYDWIAAGGGTALDLYAENPSSPTAPSATGNNAVAIGSNTEATGDRSMALIEGANATSLRAFAVGFNATASNFNTISMGPNSVASGNYSVAIGSATDATAQGGLAVGFNAQAVTGVNATALTNSYASGADSFAAAIASNSSSYGATGANSVAIGQLSKATGSNSVAIGLSANASNTKATAIGGEGVQATGFASLAFGDGSRSTGTGATSLGMDAEATANYGLAIGGGTRASAIESVAIGRNANASGRNSFALGYLPLALQDGKYCYASGTFSSASDAQTGTFVLRSDTTDATSEALTTNNAAAGTTNQVILPNNSAYSFSGTIIARQQASAGSEYASWEIKGALLRDGSAATTVLGNGIKNKLYASAGASAWDVSLTADTTNGGLAITVTGAAATNIRWVATVNTSEVTY